MAGRYGRDHQKSRVYAWESAYVKLTKVNFYEARALVREVWADYRGGVNTPRVQKGRRNWYRASEHKINLSAAVRMSTVLHEAAHALIRTDEDTRHCVSHGPEWARVYIGLLARYMGHSEEHLRFTATFAKVEIA